MPDLTLYTANYEHSAEVFQSGRSLCVRAPYHAELVEELKRFDRARWDGGRRVWTFPATHRNLWALRFMSGNESVNRYYEDPDPDSYVESDVPTLVHALSGDVMIPRLKQFEMVRWVLQKRQCILAADMRTGKTLVYFLLMLLYPDKRWWVVAPKKVLKALAVEIKKWGFEHPHVEFMTYEQMKKRVTKQWGVTRDALPWGVIYDESSKLKGNSQRTRAALKLSEAMDDEWGLDCIRVLGSGTAMPKNHLDWYFQCEVARPGYLPWGNIHKFDEWLSVREKMVGQAGQEFWSRVQWRDGGDCLKCDGTGTIKRKRRLGGYDHIKCVLCDGVGAHVDRISELEEWLAGIAIVVRKSDVMELPDKEVVVVSAEPTGTMTRVAKAITEQGLSAIEVMSRHRQLSDGFQYVREPVLDEDGQPVLDKDGKEKVKIKVVRGKVSPKMEQFKMVLAAHEEVGRFVAFGAYTASIDWLCDVAEKEGWKVIRIDGAHDVVALWDRQMDGVDALLKFDDRNDTDKVVVIGHAKSMAYGFDLSASPGFGFYSLDYDGETYMQAIERGHSSGMNFDLGCTLYFFECLPTDGLVRANVTEKQGVQDVTLNNIQDLYRG